jgi:hypothetical protein
MESILVTSPSAEQGSRGSQRGPTCTRALSHLSPTQRCFRRAPGLCLGSGRNAAHPAARQPEAAHLGSARAAPHTAGSARAAPPGLGPPPVPLAGCPDQPITATATQDAAFSHHRSAEQATSAVSSAPVPIAHRFPLLHPTQIVARVTKCSRQSSALAEGPQLNIPPANFPLPSASGLGQRSAAPSDTPSPASLYFELQED